MADYPNFYENLKEAHMRLKGTVVLYDGEPFYLFAITNHKPDGIFRVYLDPTGWDPNVRHEMPGYENYIPESNDLGVYLDDWMTARPGTAVLRKKMSSALFDKFRPFPLGMCNHGKQVYYCERQPVRPRTEQGLTRNMITATAISLGTERVPSSMDPVSPQMRACILGDHPKAEEVLDALVSGRYDNEAVAFHRHFAFVRGPIGMVFLAYKTDVIGVLPKNNFEYVRLGDEFKQNKEVVENLKLFNNII
jgi:hypothetical protein